MGIFSRLKSLVAGNTRKKRRGEEGESLLGNKQPQSDTRRGNKQQSQANFENEFRRNMNKLLKLKNNTAKPTIKRGVSFANRKGKALEQVKIFENNNIVPKPAAPAAPKKAWNNNINWEKNPFANSTPLPPSLATPTKEWDPFGNEQPKKASINNNNPFAEGSRALKAEQVKTGNLLGLGNRPTVPQYEPAAETVLKIPKRKGKPVGTPLLSNSPQERSYNIQQNLRNLGLSGKVKGVNNAGPNYIALTNKDKNTSGRKKNNLFKGLTVHNQTPKGLFNGLTIHNPVPTANLLGLNERVTAPTVPRYEPTPSYSGPLKGITFKAPKKQPNASMFGSITGALPNAGPNYMELSNNGKNTKKLKPLDPQIAKWGPIGRNASTVNANKGIGNSNWLSAMKGIAPPPPVMGRTKPKSRFLGASAPTAAPISGLASLNTPPQNENNVFPAAKPAAAAENEASWFNNPLFGTKRKGPLVSAQRANEQLTAMEQKFREINKLKGNSAAKNARIAALEAQLKKAEAEVSRLTGKAKTRAALGPFARS